MKKLIVLQVPNLKLGGAEKNLVWLGHHLQEKGYQVQVWVYDKSGPQVTHSLEVISVYNDLDVPKILIFFLRIYYLSKKIKSEKPFAIISFLESISLPGLMASYLTGNHKKQIVSVRGNPERFTWYYNLLVPLIYPKAKYVVIPSARAGRYLEKKFDLKNVVAVPNTKPETDNTGSVTDPQKIMRPIVSIGRMIQTKRFDLVVEIVGSLPKDMRNLTLIGDGPLKMQIIQLAQERGLQLNHIPHVKGSEVPTYLADASLLLSASETECWPNVIVESLSSGTPAIAADINFGPSEIIEEGSNGFLFQPGNVEEAARKIEAILSSKELYTRMALSTKPSVEKYAAEHIIEKWIELIEA